MRLRPLTDRHNKHLIEICGRPMVAYSLAAFVSAGVRDVTLVTNPHHIADFDRVAEADGLARLFDSFRVVPQKEKPGIAGSILMMPKSHRIGPYMVVLGDNIIGGSLRPFREEFERDPDRALILLTEVTSPEAFGVARIENGRVQAIEEKPEKPDSHWVIIGVYFFPKDIFEIAGQVRPSDRGEYEITEVLNAYLREGRLDYRLIDFWWIDAGTHASLEEARRMINPEFGLLPDAGR